YFTITEVNPLQYTNEQFAKEMKTDAAKKYSIEQFLAGHTPEHKAKAASYEVIMYNNRPAAQIVYDAQVNNRPTTGKMIVIFIEEKKIVVGFNCFTLSGDGLDYCGETVSSLKILKP